MKINSGTVACTITSTGPSAYSETQNHSWSFGASTQITSARQQLPCTWAASGSGSFVDNQNNATSWVISGSQSELVNVSTSSGNIIINQNGMHSVNVGPQHDVYEPVWPTTLIWSQNYSGSSLTHTEFITVFLTILSGKGVPFVLGKNIPRVIGQTIGYLTRGTDISMTTDWMLKSPKTRTIWWDWNILLG
jgi:hypothetical protein